MSRLRKFRTRDGGTSRVRSLTVSCDTVSRQVVHDVLFVEVLSHGASLVVEKERGHRRPTGPSSRFDRTDPNRGSTFNLGVQEVEGYELTPDGVRTGRVPFSWSPFRLCTSQRMPDTNPSLATVETSARKPVSFRVLGRVSVPRPLYNGGGHPPRYFSVPFPVPMSLPTS